MTTLQALALVALTVWIAPVALLFAWVLRDRSHDEPDREGPTPEWLADLAPERPALPQRRPSDLSAHPSAARIRDRIAANEAARIDDEWKAMNA